MLLFAIWEVFIREQWVYCAGLASSVLCTLLCAVKRKAYHFCYLLTTQVIMGCRSLKRNKAFTARFSDLWEIPFIAVNLMETNGIVCRANYYSVE